MVDFVPSPLILTPCVISQVTLTEKGFQKTELDGEASCYMTKIGLKMSKENKRRTGD